MPKVALHRLVQFGDLQSGFCRISKSRSSAGIGDGWGRACGLAEKNVAALLQDSASASPLSFPFTCEANRLMLNFAVMNDKHLRKCMASGSLLSPELRLPLHYRIGLVLFSHTIVLPRWLQPEPPVSSPLL